MKKLLIVALMAGTLAACGSSPTQEQKGATVEERKPGEVVDRPPVKPAETKPLTDKPFAGSPLKDPNNILSKRSVFFDYDSNAVKDEYRSVVQAHSSYMGDKRDSKIRIEGNCDERGSREYNLALGQRRSDAVKQMMQLLGAKADQVESVSFGEEKPRCTEQSESCWSQNRRGDMLYGGEY